MVSVRGGGVKPYYDQDGITIYHGDCREVLAELSGAFDMVFTSPPYNLGVSTGGDFRHWQWVNAQWKNSALAQAGGYSEHEDAMSSGEYETWQRLLLSDCWNRLSDTGAIFYNHKPRVQGKELWTPLVLNPGLPLRQIITWARDGGFNYTHTQYVPMYEWIMIFAKPEWRLRDKGASGVGDVWRVSQERNSLHPAPFPIGLPARAIETARPLSILDPFVGSGSTLLAAKQAGIRGVGIDSSEAYCEMAARRLAQGVLAFGDA